MYDVLTVADTILKIAKARGNALSPLQLMKLVYIAHGWSLGMRNKKLFHNRIEAWRHGPIIPDLYYATKIYGRSEIPLGAIGDEKEIDVSNEDRLFLEDVLDKYGHLYGMSLSYITHKEGTPWHEVNQRGVPNEEITDDLITRHYKDLALAGSKK